MKPTARLLAVVVTLALLSGLALAWRSLTTVILLADLALLALVTLDFLLTPAPGKALVERDVPARIGLSQPLVRMLRIRLPRPAGVFVEAHEEYPSSFRVDEITADGETVRLPATTPSSAANADAAGQGGEAAPARGERQEWAPDGGAADAEGCVTLRRVYAPTLRGVHALGDLRLVVRGPFGLVERCARLSDAQPVRVEPALVGLSRTLALAASERWHDLGLRRLRRRGGETEFESLRELVPGDDIRRVDWKAFARRGVPMVRELELERGQELVLLIDRGRRMRTTAASDAGGDAGLGAWTKLDWALDASLQLAAVALAKGDRVGIASFDRRVQNWVSPARGARQLQRLAGAVFDLQASDSEADLERALSELAARHRRRATVVVISDVADPLSVPRQRRALGAASRRHKLVFAALDDPDLRAASTGAVAGRSVGAAVRAAASDLLEDRRRGLVTLAGSGVRVLDALPAELAGPLLAAWLDSRHEKPTRLVRA